MQSDLLKKNCVPCEGGAFPLARQELAPFMGQVEGWTLSEDATEISKEYKFKDFIGAVNFINHVAEIAEAEGHHPDIHLTGYNKVKLVLSTHAIGGLSENDFILAAKVDASKN